MPAFNSDPLVKAQCLAQLTTDIDYVREVIGLIQQQNMYGGAFTEQKVNKLGIPSWLARLVSAILDGQPADNSGAYLVQTLKAIPVGADLSVVEWQLAIVRANKTLTALTNNDEDYAKETRAAIELCKDYCNSVLTGNPVYSKLVEAIDACEQAAAHARLALSQTNPEAWSYQSAAQSAVQSLTRSSRATVSAAQVFRGQPEVDYYVFESLMLTYLLAKAPIPAPT